MESFLASFSTRPHALAASRAVEAVSNLYMKCIHVYMCIYVYIQLQAINHCLVQKYMKILSNYYIHVCINYHIIIVIH